MTNAELKIKPEHVQVALGVLALQFAFAMHYGVVNDALAPPMWSLVLVGITNIFMSVKSVLE